MKLLKLLSYYVVFSFSFCQYYAQGSAGTSADQELRRLVDFPTAGVLKKGHLGLSIHALYNGVIISELSYAPFKNFNVGISYGGKNIIGIGNADFYKFPGFHAKLKLFTESKQLPAFSIGFDSQGRGEYIDSLDRYEIKSPGIYFSILKNFKLLGFVSIHSLVNYTLENREKDRNLNFMFGFEKTIGPFLSFVAEYDMGLNDNLTDNSDNLKGYLNMGLRWAVSNNLTVGFDFRDILHNNRIKARSGTDRALYIEYFNSLF